MVFKLQSAYARWLHKTLCKKWLDTDSFREPVSRSSTSLWVISQIWSAWEGTEKVVLLAYFPCSFSQSFSSYLTNERLFSQSHWVAFPHVVKKSPVKKPGRYRNKYETVYSSNHWLVNCCKPRGFQYFAVNEIQELMELTSERSPEVIFDDWSQQVFGIQRELKELIDSDI